jgi:hypothetical protein
MASILIRIYSLRIAAPISQDTPNMFAAVREFLASDSLFALSRLFVVAFGVQEVVLVFRRGVF